MNGGRRRSMLGTRTSLGLQPIKLALPGKESSHLGRSGRKNRPFMLSKSPRSDQGVVKRLFDDTIRSDRRSPHYARLNSVKEDSPSKTKLSQKTEKKNEASQSLTKTSIRESPRNWFGRGISSSRSVGQTLSTERAQKAEALKKSKFDLLNSSHYSHLNVGKTIESPKSPIFWSKYKRAVKTEEIKSPDSPECLSRTLSVLTSTAQKNTSNTSSKGSKLDTSLISLESPHLSAIKVMKPIEKTGMKSVKSLYAPEDVNASFNKSVLNDRTIDDNTTINNDSNDDSFLNNETLCLMDADKTVKNIADSKEDTLKNTSRSMNKSVLPTPRKLSIIREEAPTRCNSIDLKKEPEPCASKAKLTLLQNCVNDLTIHKESFLCQQNTLFNQMKSLQDNFFSKQNEILAQVNDILSNFDREVDEKKLVTAIAGKSLKNEVITDCIAGNGNDEDEDLLGDDLSNDGNNSLICATKKLKIFDDNFKSESPRRSLRILDKVESAKKQYSGNNGKVVKTPEKAKDLLNFLNPMETEEIMTEFKENSLRTPVNQKQSAESSGSNSKYYSAKRLSQSAIKAKLRTPPCPRKSLIDKTLAKCETPNKRSKKSPAGRKSIRLTRTPNLHSMGPSDSPNDDTTILMKNLRRSCAFLKTPKNTSRMSINVSNILTPHSMSYVVQDQMKNIFNS